MNSIDLPRQAFGEVNGILTAQGKAPLFNVQLVGITDKISLNNGLYEIFPDALIDDVRKTDLIIVPAMEGDLPTALEENSGFIPWIVRQHENGSEVASLCVGAFLLASTGLLNGTECSTHWRAANAFSVLFPEVNLVADKIITDNKGTYTSGGAFSSANLILYLIEKYVDRDTAIKISKLFQVDIERNSQSQFLIFSGQKDHRDDVILSAQNFIEDNYKEKITINVLAEKFNLGRRTLERRFKNATSNTVLEYLQRVRIEVAKTILEKGRKNVNEVMFDVGYSDNKSFRCIFKKIVGMSPVDYKNKFDDRKLHLHKTR